MMDKLYQYVSTKENVGINLCRISIAIVFMWIGLLKFIPYEADSIVPFVANSPFMSFFYNDPSNYTQFMNHEGELIEANRAWHHANNTYGYSTGLGIVEVIFSLLILAHYVSPKIGFWGATLAFLTPFVTLTFLIFTPETLGKWPGFSHRVSLSFWRRATGLKRHDNDGCGSYCDGAFCQVYPCTESARERLYWQSIRWS